MSQCKIDHSREDVRSKYLSQVEFLPMEMRPLFKVFFQGEHTQEILNEVFHLLKKYDLSTDEEKETRNRRLLLILNNLQ
jgi:hypothetical protein